MVFQLGRTQEPACGKESSFWCPYEWPLPYCASSPCRLEGLPLLIPFHFYRTSYRALQTITSLVAKTDELSLGTGVHSSARSVFAVLRPGVSIRNQSLFLGKQRGRESMAMVQQVCGEAPWHTPPAVYHPRSAEVRPTIGNHTKIEIYGMWQGYSSEMNGPRKPHWHQWCVKQPGTFMCCCQAPRNIHVHVRESPHLHTSTSYPQNSSPAAHQPPAGTGPSGAVSISNAGTPPFPLHLAPKSWMLEVHICRGVLMFQSRV